MKGKLLKVMKNRSKSAKHPSYIVTLPTSVPTHVSFGSSFDMNEQHSTINRLHSRLIQTAAQSLHKPTRIYTPSQYSPQLQNKSQKPFRTKQLSCKLVSNFNKCKQQQNSKKLMLKSGLKNLGEVEKQQLLDSQYQNQCSQIKRHSRFRNTLPSKNQLLFLKPHMKFNNKLHVQQFKSALYHQINTSVSLQVTPFLKTSDEQSNNQPRFIEYMTQYDPTIENHSRNKKQSQIKSKRKNKYSNILRQKIRNHYKQSHYFNKIKLINQHQRLQLNAIKL